MAWFRYGSELANARNAVPADNWWGAALRGEHAPTAVAASD